MRYEARVEDHSLPIAIHLFQHHLLKGSSFPAWIALAPLSEISSSYMTQRVYFLAFYSIPSIYVFIHMPISLYLDYCAFKVSAEFRLRECFLQLVLFQNCFNYSRSMNFHIHCRGACWLKKKYLLGFWLWLCCIYKSI